MKSRLEIIEIAGPLVLRRWGHLMKVKLLLLRGKLKLDSVAWCSGQAHIRYDELDQTAENSSARDPWSTFEGLIKATVTADSVKGVVKIEASCSDGDSSGEHKRHRWSAVLSGGAEALEDFDPSLFEVLRNVHVDNLYAEELTKQETERKKAIAMEVFGLEALG